MQRVKRLFNRKRTKPIARISHVRLLGDGFVATMDGQEDEVTRWSEIERIYTCKVDCFAYDTIWLAFKRQGRGALFMSEDVVGFDNLKAAMNESIPGINPEWFHDVMLPAFAENFAVLYQRQTEG